MNKTVKYFKQMVFLSEFAVSKVTASVRSVENRVFAYAFWRQTARQTNRWTASLHKGTRERRLKTFQRSKLIIE